MNLARTGMTRHRYDDLWKALRWSDQPEERPEGMSSERYRWKLVSDFVDRFNEHRATRFIPSDRIYCDESMSKLYGLGGHWINIGLPMYVAMDRKPVNGCEIQNILCGRSQIMMQIKLVETAEEENVNQEVYDYGQLHGTKVMLDLLTPWHNDGDRLVCADSYFASVPAVLALRQVGLRFIGVIKTSTWQYPLAYLNGLELNQRGDHRALLSKDDEGNVEALAVMWVDRERRFFVSNAQSIEQAEPIYRTRWRYVDTTANADPERLEIAIEQPDIVKCYYETCSQIDRHNKIRQDELELERKIGAHDWSKRVNTTIFAMIIVDTMNFHQACVHPNEIDGCPDDFISYLSEEMIDNTLDEVGTRGRRGLQPGVVRNNLRRAAPTCSPHLSPCKDKRRRRTGALTNYTKQGYCKGCGMKTTHVCSECEKIRLDNPDGGHKQAFFCHYHRTRKNCFERHIMEEHQN